MKLSIFSKLITLLWLVSCVTGLQADFVSLSIWERTTTTGEKQHLVCLGDQHDLISQAGEQSDDLINWLERRSNPNDIVLIEDQSDVAYIIDQARTYLKEHNKAWDDSCLQNIQMRYDNEIRPFTFTPSDDNILTQIGQKLLHKSVRSHNVDFRFLLYTFRCLSSDWHLFLANELHDFVVKQIIKEVSLYNDSPFLNSYYQRCIKPLCSILKESESISHKNIVKLLTDYNGKPKVLDFLPHKDSFYGFIECNLTYDLDVLNALAQYLLSDLMDARLLHHIYQEQVQKDQANIAVACAGFLHIWNIETKLFDLGYARIHKVGASSINDIEKGLGLSKKLSYWLNKLSSYQLYLQQVELERKRIKRRIKHMILDFDTDMTYPNYSPSKQQAKL